MSEIGDLAAPLIARPLAAPPAIEELVLRDRRARTLRRRRRAGMAGALLILVGSAQWSAEIDGTGLAAGGTEPELSIDTGGSGASPAADPRGPVGAPAGGAAQQAPTEGGRGAPPERRVECAPGRNAGATDVGVTGTRINLLMTVVLDGPAEPYLRGAREVARALVDEVNRRGGICGRTLHLQMRNGWAAPAGDSLAMLVTPLTAELDTWIASGRATRDGIPIVGTDGLTNEQSQSPWVWPVGTSAAAQVRIAVDHAYGRDGARTFALVHDGTVPGHQAAQAFTSYVERLPGARVRTVELAGSGPAEFNEACGEGRCDAVVLALGPGAFEQWRGKRPASARLRTAVLSTALHEKMPDSCGTLLAADDCENVLVWTPYTPPTGGFLGDPAVAAYHQMAGDDVSPLTEGAYVGMLRLIEALAEVGPVVTRKRLQAVLDGGDYRSGLVDLLRWSPTDRAGNVSARALGMRYGHLADAGTGWVRDPLARR